MADKTPTTVQVFHFVNGKSEIDTGKKITEFQLINNSKYSVGFDYETNWFGKKSAVVSFYIDVRYANANFPRVAK